MTSGLGVRKKRKNHHRQQRQNAINKPLTDIQNDGTYKEDYWFQDFKNIDYNNLEFRNIQRQFENELQNLQFHVLECLGKKVINACESLWCEQSKRNPSKITVTNKMDPRIFRQLWN